MSSSLRVCVVVGSLLAMAAPAIAGPVTGKIDVPGTPPVREPASRGFLKPAVNPFFSEARKVSYGPLMAVALEGGAAPEAPGQRVWGVVGESFATPVFIVPVGSEVVIKNVSKTARRLYAEEDAQLLPADPINPTATKTVRAAAPNIYAIRDKDAPHLRGALVVVGTPYVALVDDAGRFTIPDVPEGTYKLRVFYKDAWLDGATEVSVGKGKTEVNPKIPALTPAKK